MAKSGMRDGEICIFQIPIGEDLYQVRCECYESLFDGKLAYGSTYFKNGEEILHAGRGPQIDTVDKARKSIKSTISLREELLARANDLWEDNDEH